MKQLILIGLFCWIFGACTNDEGEDCMKITWYYDKDEDGLGRPDSSVFQCEQPEGFVANGFDGDDEPVIPPPDPRVPFVFTPGTPKAFYLYQTDAPYGFWFYAPINYDSTGSTMHPLLIHLHGLGERGNSAENPNGMNIILWNGAPRLIRENRWQDPHDMIVVAPQAEAVWSANSLHSYIEFLISKLQIDESRIYMTGLSFGANGTFNYVSEKGDEAYVAAIVPIAGWGDTTSVSQFKNIPTWAFHGDADDIVSVNNSIEMVEAINAAAPKVPAKLTIYPGVTHDSWARTYDGTGMGDESENHNPFDISIWDWMYQYTKED